MTKQELLEGVAASIHQIANDGIESPRNCCSCNNAAQAVFDYLSPMMGDAVQALQAIKDKHTIVYSNGHERISGGKEEYLCIQALSSLSAWREGGE
jgi:hypothetical protein